MQPSQTEQFLVNDLVGSDLTLFFVLAVRNDLMSPETEAQNRGDGGVTLFLQSGILKRRRDFFQTRLSGG